MPTLSLTTTDGSELNFELTEDVHTLGRLGENDLHVPDASVSSRHAEFHRGSDGSYELVDLESTNGTKISGEPVERTMLSGGESILFGHVQAVYQTEETSAAADHEAGADADSETPAQQQAIAPEEVAAQGEITSSSARPDDFDSSSPFGPKQSRNDPLAKAAMGIGITALAACLIAVLMVLRMEA